MALSDYAFISFNNSGESSFSHGMFGRISIEPYKTWLYIHSKDIWKEKEGFIEDTIGQISEGEISLLGVTIIVKNIELSNKEGVPYHTVKLFYCQSGYGEERQSFGGVVCYAYLDYERAIARNHNIPDNWDVYQETSFPEQTKILACYPPMPDYEASEEEWDKHRSQKIEIPINQNIKFHEKMDSFASYCGITDDMVEAFLNWDVPDKDWLVQVRAAKKVAINKGNLFFQEQGVVKDVSVPVGEQDVVLAQEIIKNVQP